ncbi:polysaccharide lyase [Actinoplanes sp. NBRC 101535]|uniref:polysaccharide lyase n=1 Tax=Actinoplanes sp. NBRC 101535 TaxID=3032196 RepID=UPI0024A541A2|nr:polysaccharide lyase [Actinoplanes sp. NBRC 101535]GLY03945.1 hypothetical protein Acsp01_43240 [Actinoplanes sp. NBRC 101535]
MYDVSRNPFRPVSAAAPVAPVPPASSSRLLSPPDSSRRVYLRRGSAALLGLALGIAPPLVVAGPAAAALECYQPSWSAPGESLSEWNTVQVPAGTTDRLTIVPAPQGNSPHALRAEVRDGDVAVNPANGQPIAGGWRAEGVRTVAETASNQTVRYEWSTMLDPTYPQNPVGTDGKPIWQVITQWHQGDNDQGSSPPVAFIIESGQIVLHLTRPDGTDAAKHVLAPIARGTWHHFRMDVRWGLAGSVTVWHNNTQVLASTAAQTLFPQLNSAQPGTAYMKMGLYRKPIALDPPTTGTFAVFHDEVRRSIPATPVTGPETVLRPDGDVLRQWTGGTTGTAAAALDDAVTQPTAVPAADYIYAGGPNRVTEVTLADQALSGGTSALTGWFYGNAGAGTQLRADLVQGATVLATTTVPASSGFGWRSISGPATAALSQQSLTDTRLRFTTIGGGDSNIRAAYATSVPTTCPS